MAKKKQDTGIDLKEVKNGVGEVIVSRIENGMIMVRLEHNECIISSIIITEQAAYALGISTVELTTIGKLEKQGRL